jgi:hypothetical protein
MAHTQTEELFVLNTYVIANQQCESVGGALLLLRELAISRWCRAQAGTRDPDLLAALTARDPPTVRRRPDGRRGDHRSIRPACAACRSLSSAVCCSHALMPRFDCCRDVMPSAAHGQDPSLPYQNPSNSRNLRGMCPHRTSFGSTTTSVHYSCLWKNILYTIRLACENTIHYSCIYGQLLARKNII